ncbi:TraB/GumN family protein [Lysobacter olei]
MSRRPNALGLILGSATLISAVAWAATEAPRVAPAPTRAMAVAKDSAVSASLAKTAEAPGKVADTSPVPLLWKVSDRDNAVYLLGSLHLLKPSDYPLSGDVDRVFDEAEKVVFEVALDELSDPATAQKFMLAAGYSDDRRLSNVVPPVLREKLDRLLARQGGSIAAIDGFEPWFVNLSLTLGMAGAQGFRAEMGLDQHLARRALEAGKVTGALESIDFQLNALDASPMDEQVAGLVDFVDRVDEMPKVLNELHDAWRNGDTVRLEQLTRVEMQEKAPASYQIMNVQRNDAWVPQLQAMLDGHGKDSDVLVVVGSLHLLGSDGVVEKLRAKGYAVERICAACGIDGATPTPN